VIPSATELVWFLFSTGGAILVLGLLSLFVVVRPKSSGARTLLALAAVSYWVASTWHVSQFAIEALGQDFDAFDATDVPEGRVAVVVLGSGSFTARDWDDATLSITDPWATGRVLEAARVFRLVDPAWVISSGGLVHPDQPHESTGITMERALVGLGVPKERIVSETQSRNTAAEAEIVAPMLEKLGVDHTILVTSKFHMWRSVGAFRARGVTVIPAPARNPNPPRGWATRWLPSHVGLDWSAMAVHEGLGLVYYRLQGWYR